LPKTTTTTTLKKTTTMKTIIHTMIVLFALNANMLIAGGIKHNTSKPETGKIELAIDLGKLVPATPAIAEFTDGIDLNSNPDALLGKLSPVTPAEADFEDPSEVNTSEIAAATPGKLAPATPAEADFME
jgi:hypothetical protein